MASSANDRQVGGQHYKSKIQHWDYVLANNIPYLEAQIIKYLTRWRDKGGKSDLRKAQHFLQKLFESEGVDWSTELSEDRLSPAARDKVGSLEAMARGPVPPSQAEGPLDWPP